MKTLNDIQRYKVVAMYPSFSRFLVSYSTELGQEVALQYARQAATKTYLKADIVIMASDPKTDKSIATYRRLKCTTLRSS